MSKRPYKGRSDVLPFDSATDLQYRLARSFALLTDWMGALVGQYDLSDVLATLARQTQSATACLYRLDLASGQAREILVHQRVNDDGRPLKVTGTLARFALAQEQDEICNGHIWRLSSLRDKAGFAGGEADREWQRRPDTIEVSLILLERTDAQCDLLELSFETLPPRSPELPTSIVTNALSDVWLLRSPGIVTRLIARNSRRQSAPHLDGVALLGPENPYALTPAEMRVCSHLAGGLTAKAIAQTLGLSVATVRTHLRNLYSKTNTEGQVALIALAQSGYVLDA